VSNSVGFTAEIEKPTSAVPAHPGCDSPLSVGLQNANRTPSPTRTMAVAAWETGTTHGCRAKIVVNPQKATPA
jgi:hypothetical protein